MNATVAVIGGGFGGLATAVRLQRRGFVVHLLESRDQLGGRASVYRQDGFTFDAGPTVITAPFLLNELFEEAGRKLADYIQLTAVDPFYRIALPDGRFFEYNGDEVLTEKRVADFSPGDVDGYRAMIRHSKRIFEKGFLELSDRPFLRFRDMTRIAPDLLRLRSHQTVYRFVAAHIKDPALRRVFSFHPLLVGGNPFQTTSIYALIHYLERHWGVYYALGGTGTIIRALAQLLRELGGHIHLNTPIKRIQVRNGAAVGVTAADGRSWPADAVVSNADVANTYMKLIAPQHRRKYTDRRLQRMSYSMSLFVTYFGTKKQYPAVPHHTILFGKRYRELLHDIFRKHVLPPDFSLYLHRPTATDVSMAPKNCDCFYVLAPVPNQKSRIDWTKEAKPFRDAILKFLNDTYLPDLLDNIVTERVVTPLDFETDLDSYLGAGFSFTPVFRQSAWFRPHNESEDVRNLFLTGAGTHPGAGVPGVLCSAKIAEHLLCERFDKQIAS